MPMSNELRELAGLSDVEVIREVFVAAVMEGAWEDKQFAAQLLSLVDRIFSTNERLAQHVVSLHAKALQLAARVEEAEKRMRSG